MCELGRSKEFDAALALRKEMEVFGQYGYEGASLQGLLSHLGIAHQSLYNTFGTKRDLFLVALKGCGFHAWTERSFLLF